MGTEKTKASRIYCHIEQLQGKLPWGKMLDAGTGVNSLNWAQSLPTDSLTAIAGSLGEAKRAENALPQKLRAQDQIIVGNWASSDLLKGAQFDTVLADYLLGAIEGFAPFFQPYLFQRLRPLTKKTLYVTGLEPYVPMPRPEGKSAQILWEIGRFRDSCVLLSGDMPYREYPSKWVLNHIERAGFKITHIQHFDIDYKATFINAQITIAQSAIAKITDPKLQESLKEKSENLRQNALEELDKNGALRGCQNYVIRASVS